MRATTAARWRGVSIVEAAVLFALVGILLVQRQRGAWPFSVRDQGADRGGGVPATEPSPAGPEASPATDPHAAHRVPGRVDVEGDPAQWERAGIRMVPAASEQISRPTRAVATVALDETRISHVHTRVSGWIEKLHVSATGQAIRAGQPVASIFSQELMASQNEYLSVKRAAAAGGGSTALLEGARGRLRVLGMSDAEVAVIDRTGVARRTVTVIAPRSGVILRRGVTVGAAVDPSTEIVTIADVSAVWVFAEIPESDIPGVTAGTPALLSFPASGRAPFEAKVDFVYPTMSERTRTLRIRFAVTEAAGLRAGMYGTAELRTQPRVAVTVPRDAVVDLGASQHVYVESSTGMLTPRKVVIGARHGDLVEIREGLAGGELVVASGVFLIDSESRLRASGQGGSGGSGGGGHAGHGQ